jgi:flagellar biosynthesis protein
MNDAVTKRVVGLQYTAELELPRIVAKGVGPVADEMLKATLHVSGPRLVRDAELLERLYRLSVDATIDPKLFQLVATVLTYVFAINEKIKESNHV